MENKEGRHILPKILGIIFIIIMAQGMGILLLFLLVAVFLIPFYAMFDRDPHSPGSDETYLVININGKDTLDEENPYYFYIADYENAVYKYSLEDNEEAAILKEGQEIVYFDTYEDWIFYGLDCDGDWRAAEEIWEYNWVTGEKNLLCDDAECTYIAVYNDYLLYNNHSVDYIQEISEGKLNGAIETFELFMKEDKSGNEQFTVFQGMILGRYYNNEKDKYYINCIAEAETGKRIEMGSGILADGRLYVTDHSEMEKKFYKLTGGYNSSDSFSNNLLTAENGRIIGLVSAAYRHGESQAIIKFDFLFDLDPKTEQMGILYRQETNMPRIIGYRDGTVYLMENYALYKEPVDGGERIKLFDLPEEKEMVFSWHGSWLIVKPYAGGRVMGAYLVE